MSVLAALVLGALGWALLAQRCPGFKEGGDNGPAPTWRRPDPPEYGA